MQINPAVEQEKSCILYAVGLYLYMAQV